MNERTNELQRSGRSPVRYSQRKNTDHTTVDVHAENVLVNKLT